MEHGSLSSSNFPDTNLLPVKDLYDHVANAAECKHRQQDVELHLRAERGGIGVGNDEAGGLPQAVIGEGSLLVASEEQTVQAVDLRLPHGIADAPQSGHGIENDGIVGIGSPEQLHGDQSEVDDGAENDDGCAADVLHHGAKQDRAEGVDHAEADHHKADLVHTKGAGHIGLGEVGTDEGLLHANEDGDRNEQLQVGLLHLSECGWQQLDSRELGRRVGTLALLTIPLQRIQKEGDNAHGSHNAGKVNHGNLKDLILWRTLQVAVTAAAGCAEVCTAEQQVLLADGRVRAAAATSMGAAGENWWGQRGQD